MKNKSKNKLNFSKYIGIVLVIVTLIVIGLIGFINILPLEHFIVFIILLIIIDVPILVLLFSRGIKNALGVILAVLWLIVLFLGINYEINTLDFFKQYGFNTYKSENYNVVVLKKGKFESLKDLNDKVVGHLDLDIHKGLKETIDKIAHKINYKSKEYADISELCTNLVKNNVSAIILEDAQLAIIEEEQEDVFEQLEIVDSFKIEN